MSWPANTRTAPILAVAMPVAGACDLLVAGASCSSQLTASAIVSLIVAPISKSQLLTAQAACESKP